MCVCVFGACLCMKSVIEVGGVCSDVMTCGVGGVCDVMTCDWCGDVFDKGQRASF